MKKITAIKLEIRYCNNGYEVRVLGFIEGYRYPKFETEWFFGASTSIAKEYALRSLSH